MDSDYSFYTGLSDFKSEHMATGERTIHEIFTTAQEKPCDLHLTNNVTKCTSLSDTQTPTPNAMPK